VIWWHTIWPGWSAYLSSIVMGVLSLPVMVPMQIIVMRFVSRIHVRKQVNTELEHRLPALLAAAAAEHVAATQELRDRIDRLETRRRSDIFRGW
jgi:hypothetical protein